MQKPLIMYEQGHLEPYMGINQSPIFLYRNSSSGEPVDTGLSNMLTTHRQSHGKKLPWLPAQLLYCTLALVSKKATSCALVWT